MTSNSILVDFFVKFIFMMGVASNCNIILLNLFDISITSEYFINK
jgi:hypothetical protein